MSNSFIVDSNGGISGSLTQLVDGRSYLVAGPGISIFSGSSGQVVFESNISASILNVNSSGSSLSFYGATPISQSIRVGQLSSMGSMTNVTNAWQSSGDPAGRQVIDSNFSTIASKIVDLIQKVNALEAALSQAAGGIGITQ